MDKVETYREVIKNVITRYAGISFAYGDIESQTIFDEKGDHYVLMDVGWDKHRVHGSTIHIDIIDGKCWIQYDGMETGVASDLEAAGIPKEDIVLGFRAPEIRPLSGYAVA